MDDKLIENLIEDETRRQLSGIELIASENYVSDDIYEALGSVCTNKYAEGYPDHRYYGGCEVIDKIEQVAIERVCELFNCIYANVQPHSGSQANRAVTEAILKPGDTVLSLDLNCGGHLTHSSPVSYIGKYYNVETYGSTEDGYIDYDELIEKADLIKPKLIIAGASAYSREWRYEALLEAKKRSGAILMFDMAHTAGLIAAGLLQNPCKYADIVTSTTHKTLRGPRGGIILMREDFEYEGKLMSKRINSSVFPGNQGGPLENTIAAKAVCFKEALSPEFVKYQKQVVLNAKALAEALQNFGFYVITGGTDNHSFLIDLRTKYPEMTGKEAETILGKCNITVNKNMIPGDTRSPFQTSGLRIGTPAVTTRGMKDMFLIANFINRSLSGENPERIKEEVNYFANQYPLYAW